MAEKKHPKFFHGYIVVAAAFFLMVAFWGSFYSFGVFLKPVSADLGWTRATTSGAFSLSMLLQILAGIVMGRLTDKVGPRLVVTACGLLQGLGFLLMARISNVWQLYLFYGVMIGIGMSGCWIPLTTTIARWFVKGRGTMTGIVLAGLSLGTMISGPGATRLILTYGWSASYSIIGIVVLVSLILGAQFLKREPSQMQLLPYGMNETEAENSELEARGFSVREAIHNRRFWLLLSSGVGYGILLHSITVHIVPHATELGISATSAASILAAIGGVGIAGRLIGGWAVDRIGCKLPYIIFCGMLSFAFFWLVPAREMWMLYLFAVVFGFPYAAYGALMTPLLADLFGLSSLGAISGAVSVGYGIGSAIGPVLAGRIFDLTGNYQVAWLAGGVIGIVNVVLVLLLRLSGNEGRQPASKRSP